MKYRKKPELTESVQWKGLNLEVVIEAVQWNGLNLEEVIALGGASEYEDDFTTSDLVIHTLEGDMRANKGDWIIKGVKGELYPCKPDIFAETCDLVEE